MIKFFSGGHLRSPDFFLLYYFEEGKQSYSVEILCKYAEHFEVSLNWLVLGVEPMFLRSCKPMVAVGDGIIQVDGSNNTVLR